MKYFKYYFCMGIGLMLAACGDDLEEGVGGGSIVEESKDVVNDPNQASVTGKVYDIKGHSCMVESYVNVSPETLLDEKTKVGVIFSDKNNPTIENCIAAVTSKNIIDENNKYTVKLEGLPDCRKVAYYRSFVTKSGNTLYGKVRTITQSPCKGTATMEYVDLGLPSGTKWAKRYMGAALEKELGNYYQWGQSETPKRGTYTWNHYQWCNGSYPGAMNKYVTSNVKYCSIVDNKTELDYVDDAAHMAYGANWRIPSREQILELIDNCQWTCEEQTLGYYTYYTLTATGKNGNSILLPYSGYYDSSEDPDKRYGLHSPRFWSRTLREATEGTDYANLAYSFYCDKSSKDRKMYYYAATANRYFGLCIRAVYNEKD